MRYVDLLLRCCAPVSMLAGLLGCAAVPEPVATAAQPDRAVASSAVAPAAAASAAPAAAVPPSQPAVAPAVQRAFDDARRALRAGRTQEAQRGFEALAKAHPELGGVHANLGLIHRQAGRLEPAVSALEQAVKASPERAPYHNQLGIALRMHGRFAQAREAYERAIALDPSYAAPVLNLGILNDLYLGDGKRALELYGRYLVLSPGGDATVNKWMVDLKNRKVDRVALARKEQP